MMQEWLKNKLAQNGYTLNDLALQTGLSQEEIEQAAAKGEADQLDWDVILDTLNQYPAWRYPSAQIVQELEGDISEFGGDGACEVYYGVNQEELVFSACRVLANGSIHGANLSQEALEYASILHLSLQEAKTLFEKQQFSLENAQNSANKKDCA